MITRAGQEEVDRAWAAMPAVHPVVRFVDDSGRVLFEHELPDARMCPGDDVTIKWAYPEPVLRSSASHVEVSK